MSTPSPGAAAATPKKDVCPLAAATKKDGTDTRDKKNRKKRAALNLNLKKAKMIKLDQDIITAYDSYIRERILKKSKQNDPPAFIRIAGFHVSYDEFYESLKPRGEIGTKVMALWTYQYNLDEKDKWEKDRSRVKKICLLDCSDGSAHK